MKPFHAAAFVVVLLVLSVLLSAFSAEQGLKPRRIYLRDGTVDVCGRTTSGWSCRPAAAVTAFLSGNARDDCTR